MNWGIIGTGWAAGDMATALNAVNGKVYAVSNPHKKHTDDFVKKYHVARRYYDNGALMNDSQVDIVYIATPHSQHYELIKQALLAGKHVFCEKAITVTAAEFDEVAALARKRHLILMEGFTLYHMPLYQQLHQLIAAGKLGTIKMVQVNFGSLKDPDPRRRYFNRDLAGGALLDIGGYAVAFVRQFLRDLNIAATSVQFYQTGVDEMAGIVLKNGHEQMAVISLSFRAKQPKRGVVSGTKGFIEVDNYPRADQATVTYTADAHTTTTTRVATGKSDLALQYEVRDMERYVVQGHDDGELAMSADVAHLLDEIRVDWGLRFPNDK